jgi:glycosyltransferase involved in cell wall biosynthesis
MHFDLIEFPECGAEGYYLKQEASATVARLHTPWEIIHQFDALSEPVADAWLQVRMERAMTRSATAVSSPSRALADRYAKRWRLKNVTVYPNPIPVSRYRQTAGNEWIFVGRIERRKGVHILIEAYAKASGRARLPRLTLLGRAYGELPGGQAYGDSIQGLIEKYGLQERIAWIRGVAAEKVGDYLSRSSAAFFPSLWENFPYSCLEAMACGLAVVASACGGLPEIISHEKTGLLFPAGDSSALAEIMVRLAASPGTIARLGREAATAVLQYDQAAVCELAETFYQSVIRSRGNG